MAILNTPEERTAFQQYMRLMSDTAIIDALTEARERSDDDAVALLKEEADHRQLIVDDESH